MPRARSLKLELKGDEATGARIVCDALSEPARLIADNAGFEGAVVVAQLRGEGDSGNGFNAATGELVDLVKAGIIDPAKVTRSALQNAASIAALVLTTEASVVEKPEDEDEAAAAAAATATCTELEPKTGTASRRAGREAPRPSCCPESRRDQRVDRLTLFPYAALTMLATRAPRGGGRRQ